MEAILDLYSTEYNPKRPTVCFDEKPLQLLDEYRPLIKAYKAGKIQKRDYEYKRIGTANIFCTVEPLSGKHITRVFEKKTRKDFAKNLKTISGAYPEAEYINIVMDNLITHNEKSLTEYFGEDEGNKIWNRFKVFYTPKHASWLNQAEIEISICSKQCLGKRRFNNLELLTKEINAWNKAVNKKRLKINWKFTKKDARLKFKFKRSRY
jgi:hypothetical protein